MKIKMKNLRIDSNKHSLNIKTSEEFDGSFLTIKNFFSKDIVTFISNGDYLKIVPHISTDVLLNDYKMYMPAQLEFTFSKEKDIHINSVSIPKLKLRCDIEY
ncbi:hypothetical protein [Metabacillus fastidiosus]|uniref:hypothetical protein n=1 Tax=Metabacillus fastidiosus TaxID=1458 RepID=UPI003D2C1E2B